jgi:hypothetical protein
MTATKFDGEKVRLSLFPRDALMGIGQVLTFGAKKYSDWNWAQGMDWSRIYGATMRHLTAWFDGESKDPETGMSHLWHAGCNLVFLISYEARGIGKDDRPKWDLLKGDPIVVKGVVKGLSRVLRRRVSTGNGDRVDLIEQKDGTPTP